MRRRPAIVAWFILLLPLMLEAAQPKGHLVIIGGGSRTKEIMRTFVQLSGGTSGSVVVFPMASGDAAGVGKQQAAEIASGGVKHCVSLNVTREQANTDSVLRLLDNVTGVFFSGGDQSKLTAALKGTRVEQRLHEIYESGGTLGGTSAGAAVMSEIMITGTELLNKDTVNAYTSIKKNNIQTAQGFAFVTSAIVDQHFVRRKRHNRLLSLALEHPLLLCVGIDESTAIIVNPDNTFTVAGESVVSVYDASRATNISLNKNGMLSGSPVALHILQAGETFDMTARCIAGKSN
ncbi:MAG: cyanophycinase [Ignavibacteriales bacterium]|nr:cyanophycinase [Ignavibacteriales bacterium]